jgi:hypothetical protein
LDEFLLIGLFILVFVGLPIGLSLLFYFVPKKLGYPKTGKYLTIIFGILVLTVVFLTVFEDQLFTKGKAKELIEEQGIVLTDKFDLKENKSMSAIGDYYHTFTLEVSEQDKSKAIQIIKSSADFKKIGEPTTDLLFSSVDRYKGPKLIQNYETESAYVREYFQPSGREGYAPTFRRISISKNKDELTFEDIDE